MEIDLIKSISIIITNNKETMKKNIILGLALIIGLTVNAQLTDAVLYHKDGKLIKAKGAIDKAITNEKMAKKSKVWYYDGLIYMDLAKKQTDLNLKHEFYSQAIVGFQTALDKNAGENWIAQSKGKRSELYSTIFNEGVSFHGSKDFENALKFDELAAKEKVANEKRVNALINATIASGNLKMDDKSIELNKQILEITPNDAETYIELINLYDGKENLDEAMKYAEEGSTKFPKDNRFSNEVARLAIKSGKGEEAIEKLKIASEKDPKNALLLNKIADIYSGLKQMDKVEEYYKKALAIDAENIDANYNLGSFYFNKGAEIQNEINKMDLREYQKLGKSKENEAKEFFGQCIPYYEKAYNKLDAEGKKGLKPALMKAYTKVGRDEDADKL